MNFDQKISVYIIAYEIFVVYNFIWRYRVKADNHIEQQEDLVLTKAICQLIKFYALTGKDLSQMMGISESSATRLVQGKKLISPHTKEGEIAILILRVYRSLNAMLGNHHEKAKMWLNSPNKYFKNTGFCLPNFVCCEIG